MTCSEGKPNVFESLLDNWLFVRLVKNLGAGQLVEELWEECLVRLGKELAKSTTKFISDRFSQGLTKIGLLYWLLIST